MKKTLILLLLTLAAVPVMAQVSKPVPTPVEAEPIACPIGNLFQIQPGFSGAGDVYGNSGADATTCALIATPGGSPGGPYLPLAGGTMTGATGGAPSSGGINAAQLLVNGTSVDVDSRPAGSSTTGKSGTLAAGGTTSILSISGAGTITSIHLTVGNLTGSAGEQANLMQNSLISINLDGNAQIIPWGLFFQSEDDPTAFMTDCLSIAYASSAWSGGAFTYNRCGEYSFSSTASISLINGSASAAASIYADIGYRVGASPDVATRGYWNAYVVPQPNDPFPSTTLTGGGQLESEVYFNTSSVSYAYLEAAATVTADGNLAVACNGGEDCPGSGFYFGYATGTGLPTLTSNKWGWHTGTALQAKAATYDSLWYRYFTDRPLDNVIFNSSLGIAWLYGTTPPEPTGESLVTYWTTNPTAAQVTFSPASGTTAPGTVTLSSGLSGATFCSTTDNSTPTGAAGACTHGTSGAGPITVSGTTTIKAISTKVGYNTSPVTPSYYPVPQSFSEVAHNGVQCGSGSNTTVCALPTFTPGAGHELIICGMSTTSTPQSMSISGMGSNTTNSVVTSTATGNTCWVVLSAVNAAITPSTTITGSGAPYRQMFYVEFASVVPATFDTANSHGQDSGGPFTSQTTGAISTAGSNEAFFAVFQAAGGGIAASLAGGSPNAWVVADQISGGNSYNSSFYQLNAAKVTAQTYSQSMTSSAYYDNLIVALE